MARWSTLDSIDRCSRDFHCQFENWWKCPWRAFAVNAFKDLWRLKPWPNDRNLPTQHIATLLGASSCVRLATMLRCVATCWVVLAQVWKWSNLSQQPPTRRNMLQQGGQTHATCCAQQCCDMLLWHVAIVWPGLNAQIGVFYWYRVVVFFVAKIISTLLCRKLVEDQDTTVGIIDFLISNGEWTREVTPPGTKKKCSNVVVYSGQCL